jgi:hypothetical protein
MEILTKEFIQELLTLDQSPCLSLYMPLTEVILRIFRIQSDLKTFSNNWKNHFCRNIQPM